MEKMSFREWIQKVDIEAIKHCACSIHDLPDATWRDYFEDELSPAEAWDAAVEDGILD